MNNINHDSEPTDKLLLEVLCDSTFIVFCCKHNLMHKTLPFQRLCLIAYVSPGQAPTGKPGEASLEPGTKGRGPSPPSPSTAASSVHFHAKHFPPAPCNLAAPTGRHAGRCSEPGEGRGGRVGRKAAEEGRGSRAGPPGATAQPAPPAAAAGAGAGPQPSASAPAVGTARAAGQAGVAGSEEPQRTGGWGGGRELPGSAMARRPGEVAKQPVRRLRQRCAGGAAARGPESPAKPPLTHGPFRGTAAPGSLSRARSHGTNGREGAGVQGR